MKIALGLVVAALISIAGFGLSVSGAEDGSGLVLAKCSSCHSMKRVCRNLGKKDLAAWEKTNQRMADMGMTITADELDAISNYLANAKPGSNALCK
ncbi:cytochrome c [Maridesulfovibrio sp.]|uniref:cytochrome c n=1 Tax=Maridesulfovibrio sp. TaxID=2795000 RepID=UPI0029F57208|nr:cytochrome c [Maridesulfovibrio sp.]